MINSLVAQFNNSKVYVHLPEIWCRLQQELIPKTANVTNLVDLYQMLAYVKSGKSAVSYIYKTCTYAEVTDGVVTIRLNFYVWPSDLNLNYTLSANHGIISEKELVTEFISKDVIFENSSVESIAYIFSGDVDPEMPFFNDYGDKIFPTVTIDDSYIKLSQSSYCVFRVKGEVTGYKHNIEMTFPKLAEGEVFKIDNIKNTVILKYEDENKEIQTDTLNLEIPKCVEDLLSACEEGGLANIIGCAGSKCNEDKIYVVYYSTCKDDEIIEERWETVR